MTDSANDAGGTAAAARRPRGRPAVSVDRIVSAALELIDEEGADALSMRTLAQRLNSGTATLYRHFANRSEVIALVVDRVFADVDVETGPLALAWDDACRSVARAMFETLSAHRNLTALMGDEIPVGPNALRFRERALAMLLANQFPPGLAVRTYATLSRYVLGFAVQLRPPQDAEEESRIGLLVRSLDAAEFPATVAVMAHLPVPLAEEFDFGLELIIVGLREHLSRAQSHD